MSTIVERFMKDNKIQSIPRKEKDKIALLEHLCKYFEKGKRYSEREVNLLLKQYYDDFAILRRYLVDYAFLHRDLEGKSYQLRHDENETDEQRHE